MHCTWRYLCKLLVCVACMEACVPVLDAHTSPNQRKTDSDIRKMSPMTETACGIVNVGGGIYHTYAIRI